MPSVRAFIDAEIYYNTRETLYPLTERLQQATAEAANEPASDVEVFWLPFEKDNSANMTEIAVDVQLSVKGRTAEDFDRIRDRLLNVLETAEELPDGIECGVWVFPSTHSSYGMRKRPATPTNA